MSKTAIGRVHLVGAGPGDPGLLTVRASRLIAEADVILYDRLIATEALDGARADAELLFVGKEGGGPSVPQEQTEALMIARARAGSTVVRLKGGDPFVFGRGGEEALALHEAEIPFEVVPGVTSGVAAPAYAGIPVTHRGLSAGVALLTGTLGSGADPIAGHTPLRGIPSCGAHPVAGHRQAGRQAGDDPATDEASLDFNALAAFPGTLVFYMGLSRLRQICDSLIDAGASPDEPCAVIERGTFPDQRTVVATLATIVAETKRVAVRAPAITIVGAVCGLSATLDRSRQGPLRGHTIAITRARAQASELVARCRALGATVIEAPTIRVVPLAVTPLDPTPYDLVCLTSANAADLLFARLAASRPPRDARSLANARIAAIGPATATALARHGIAADIVAERAVAEGLIAALADVTSRRALIARAAAGRDLLPDALRARGTVVDILPLYETVPEPLPPAIMARAVNADYITFTSSSTVRFLWQAAPEQPALSAHTRVVSIGPATTATLREHGIEAHLQADPHDVDGIVAALIDDVTRGGANAPTNKDDR